MAVFLFIFAEKGNLGGTFIDGPTGPRKGSDSKWPWVTQLIILQLGLWMGEGWLLSKQSSEPADNQTTTSPDHSAWAGNLNFLPGRKDPGSKELGVRQVSKGMEAGIGPQLKSLTAESKAE